MVSGVNECINTWYTNPGSFKPGLSDRSCWMKRENSLNETSLAINNFLSRVFFPGKNGERNTFELTSGGYLPLT